MAARPGAGNPAAPDARRSSRRASCRRPWRAPSRSARPPRAAPGRSRSRSRRARRWSTAVTPTTRGCRRCPIRSPSSCWDNAALLSPASAKELGVENRDVVKIAAGDRSVEAAVWIVPGQADHSVALTLGWGRTKAGRIGDGRGFDVVPAAHDRRAGLRRGVTVDQDGRRAVLLRADAGARSTEGRPIAHEATLAEYQQKPNFPELDAPPPRALPLWTQQDYSKGHQWGMTIDLNACTGCSACVDRVHGREQRPGRRQGEVWRGREMHWLRIDRYFVERAEIGATAENPAVINEPLMCVHCEEAPCENVCPVNATTHGPEGLNEMAYNRCIGTRYCAQQLPVQGAPVQLPQLAQRRRLEGDGRSARDARRCSRTRTSPCASAA